jgi:hypothetical protein
MSLSDEERQTLVRMELQKAREAYEDIGILQQAGRWSGAANRLYYAVFHAVNALFIHDGLQSNSHKGSHALFSMHYIKTGVLPSDFGRLYNNLQTLREKSDYNCYYNVTEQEISEGIELASRFIDAIEKLIDK